MMDAKAEAMLKLNNLVDALEVCGVETDLNENENGELLFLVLLEDNESGNRVQIDLTAHPKDNYQIKTWVTNRQKRTIKKCNPF